MGTRTDMASDAGPSESGRDRKHKRRLIRFAAVRVIAVLIAAAVPFAVYVKLTVFTGEDIVEAVQSGHRARVWHLVKKNPELVDGPSGGFPLLHVAARRMDHEMVQVLLAVGADPNTKSRLGRTPLHYMMDPTDRLWCWAALAIVDALTEAGGDVNTRDAYGLTPLHIALGAPRRRWDRWEGRGPVAVLEALLAAGADVNAADGQGQPALHYAGRFGGEFPELLLYEVPDPSVAYSAGCDVLYAASASGERELARLLLRRGKTNEVHNAAAKGDPPLVARLLDAEPGQLNRADTWGRTPLHWAVATGEAVVAELLLRQGAQVNVGDKLGMTPLMLAAREDHAEIVQLLLEYGANANGVMGTGRSALHFAAANGCAEPMRLLLAHGGTE